MDTNEDIELSGTGIGSHMPGPPDPAGISEVWMLIKKQLMHFRVMNWP